MAKALRSGRSWCNVFSFPLKLPCLDQALLCRGEIRTSLQNCRELRDRLVNTVLSQIGDRQVIVCLDVVGLETKRLAKARDRVGDFSLLSQRLAEVAVRGSIVRRNLQGAFEMCDRVVKLSLGHQQVAKIVMGLGVIGIDS